MEQDDQIPERAKRTADNPQRVPEPGHEGAQRVPEKEWVKNNQRKDTADGLASGDGLVE